MDHEQRCQALYTEGNRPADLPDGLVVIGAMRCTLCKNSMRNTGYPSQAADGTPVTWINIDEQDGLYKFYTIPGISWSDEENCAFANGHKLGGTPFYLWVENGQVRGNALAYGELPPDGLEQLIAHAKNVA